MPSAVERTSARSDVLDDYDHRRREHGLAAALTWLNNEATKHQDPLFHILQSVQDEAARRIIQRALDKDDTKKKAWLTARLTPELVSSAGAHVGITEDKIREQCQTPLERRRLRLKVKQSVALLNMATGATGGKWGHKVCTPFELAMRERQIELQKEWANETYLYQQESGRLIKMLTILQGAGKRRVAEILALSKGLQDYGEKYGLVPMFYTLTAPGKMHPNPTIGRNSWDGSTPRMAQAWINKHHRSAYQLLREQDIFPSGIRTVEAQEDGTPHWHCCAWVRKGDEEAFEKALRQVAPSWKKQVGCDVRNMLDDYYDKEGNLQPPSKAITYLFKYILKSIGGLDESDKIDKELADSIRWQEAWRSTWNIRGYQFFGLPSQQSWRALRSIEKAPKDDLAREAWEAASNGQGCRFIEASGGLNVKRKERPLSISIEKETLSYEDDVLVINHIHIENRLNKHHQYIDKDQWRLIDKDEMSQILRAQAEPELHDEEEEKRRLIEKLLTLIHNSPSVALRTPLEADTNPDFGEPKVPKAQPCAPPAIYWEGEWYPF